MVWRGGRSIDLDFCCAVGLDGRCRIARAGAAHDVKFGAALLADERDERTAVGHVCPDHLYGGVRSEDFLREQLLGPVPVRQVGLVNLEGQDQSECIDENMPLSSDQSLPWVVSADPPFSVVFTDWLSIIAAVG